MEWPSIWFGAIVWKDISEKAPWIKPIEEVLNDNINLADYGEGLKSIRFIPIMLQPSNTIHEETIDFSSERKEITLHKKLNYDEIAQADEHSFQQMIAVLFLQSIDQYPLHEVYDFDWERFKADVGKLFEANGWLQPVQV